MANRHKQFITIFFFIASLMVMIFFTPTSVSYASDSVDADIDYALREETEQQEEVCKNNLLSMPDWKTVCKNWKKPLVTTLYASKVTLNICLIAFFAERMHGLNDLTDSLSRQNNENCSALCADNIAQLKVKANSVYFTDAIVGITTCLGATVTDLLALIAYLGDQKDAALIMLFASSSCNLITFLSTIATHAGLSDGFQKNLVGLPEEVKTRLNNAISQAIKIIIPTAIEGLPLMIGSCCAFWRR